MRVRTVIELGVLSVLIVSLGLLYSGTSPEFVSQSAINFWDGGDETEEVASEDGDIQTVAAEEPATDDFGIVAEDMKVDEYSVRRGETFADIITGLGVSYSDMVQIADAVEDEFDVKRIRAGKDYRVYTDRWLNEPRYFVYERDAVNYVVIDLKNEEEVVVGERPVETVEREVEGEIARSLYVSVLESGAHSSLVYDLAQVFAWQIDFYRVQPGDNYNVIYEEKVVDGEVIGVGDIIAARFDHMGDSFFGVYLDREDQSGYFDENGESLEKQLLQAPLEFSRISSGYSENRRHPITGQNRPHRGTDYAAPHGTPVHSVGDGVVVDAHYTRGNGNFVRIRHNATYTTQYLHLSSFADGISVGTEVEQGETIGYVGSTGLATGPHVCFRFWKDGRQVNHRELEMPPSEPVEDKYMDEFLDKAEEIIPRLQYQDQRVAEDFPALEPVEDMPSSASTE